MSSSQYSRLRGAVEDESNSIPLAVIAQESDQRNMSGPSQRQPSGRDDGDEEYEIDLKYGAQAIMSLIGPVSICLLVVVLTIRSVSYFAENPEQQYLIYASVFKEDSSKSTGMNILSAMGNALIVVCVVGVMTFVLVLLFKYECYKCITGWMVFSSVILLFMFGFIYFEQVFIKLNVAIDYITTSVLLWNFGMVGVLSIHWRGPLRLTQAYLIATSALMALVFLKRLPPFTTWALLGAIAIYDLIAVLCPRGPLKMLLEHAQQRDEPLLPSLVYSSTMVYLMTTTRCDEERDGDVAEEENESRTLLTRTGSGEESPQTSLNSVASDDIRPNPDPRPRRRTMTRQASDDDDDEEDGPKLGLGDFIFYSVLVGKAAEEPEIGVSIACTYAILSGLVMTLLLLAFMGKALPALPISIALGMLVFFTLDLLVTPFTSMLAEKLVFL